MKKLTIVALLSLMVLNQYAIAAVPFDDINHLKTLDTAISTQSSTRNQIIAQLNTFSTLSAEKYGEMRGKKLNLLERWVFKLNQKRVKYLLERNDDWDEPSTSDKILAFLAGFFFGSLALYIENLSRVFNRKKIMIWIGIGFGASLLVILGYFIFPIQAIAYLGGLQLLSILITLFLIDPEGMLSRF